jgi:hypothetical protein
VFKCVERFLAWSDKVEQDLANKGYVICCGPDGCHTLEQPRAQSGSRSQTPPRNPVAVLKRIVGWFRS